MPSVFVNLSNAGRVYLDPQDRTEVWCNFGWNTGDNQVYPAYPGEFGVTKGQYDEVVAAVKQVMDENAIPGWVPMAAILGLPCFGPCLLMAAFNGKVSKLNKMMQEAATNAAPQGVEVKVKMSQVASPSRGNWVDSVGQSCLIGEHGTPGGPPLGYSIIFKFPEPVQAWPPTRAMAVTTVPNTAADDPIQQIAMLKSLLDSGALTQAEFDSKKAALLAKL